MSARHRLKLLLLQIREDPRVRAEELASFARYAGVEVDQITVHNVFDAPQVPEDIADGFDALLVGGASEANVLQPTRFPFVLSSQRLLLRAIRRRQPTFASCFGFQLAVLALGGQIVHDEVDFEMGTIPIGLTDAAATDPLFHDVADGFPAVSVHQQKALDAPPGCVVLARTDACIHSFRVEDAPFWAFQFHPEVDRDVLVERLTVYKAKYTRDDGHLDGVLAAAVEVPESTALVGKFIDRVVLDAAPRGMARSV